jgi:lysophospholipase L1-like esterase
MLKDYPGDEATVAQLNQLAAHYSKAARSFLDLPKKPKGQALAPYRLLAIHAIELKLNVLLRHNNVSKERVRGLQHDLEERMKLAVGFRLRLKKKTADHLIALKVSREYLIHRYDPTHFKQLSQLNRLIATMNEVSQKVDVLLATELNIALDAKTTEIQQGLSTPSTLRVAHLSMKTDLH